MRLRRTELFGSTAIAGGALILFACSGGEDYPTFSEGGAPSTGGLASNTGGVAPSTGGTGPSTGGFSTGGFPPSTGGTAPSTGGTFSTGGTTGGTSTGGKGTGTTGGMIFGNTGGSKSTGGSSAGGAGGKGSGGAGGKGSGGSGGKGGASTGGAGGAGTVAFTQVVSYIRTQCGTCHAGTQAPNLSTTNATTLYNTLTTVTVRQCGTNKLVSANDPSKSALLMMSLGQCGTFRMPDGCTTNAACISTANQTMLTNWIQAGAKNP